MDDLKRIEAKLDKVAVDVSDIKVSVAVNTADLKHHIKRTDLLEAHVGSLWQKALITLSIISALLVIAEKTLQ